MRTHAKLATTSLIGYTDEIVPRKPKGEGSLFQSKGYWIYTYGYTIDGRQRKKKKRLGTVEQFATEEAAWKEAKKVRNQFITDVTSGKVMTADVEQVTCGDLLTEYVESLKDGKKPSAYVIEKCIKANIVPFFGKKKVVKLESRHFEEYRKMRRERDGVCNATVDHDFTYLKSALMREYKKTPSRVLKVPHIAKSGEDNIRQGFLELDGYEKVLAELPLSLKCIFVLGYHVGNRKGVLRNLKWKQVDLDNKVVRFVKMQNRKPVPVAAPIYGDMGYWLERQKAFRDEHLPDCEYVCFWYPTDCEIGPTSKQGHGGRRNEPGTPLISFYESWGKAVANAGVPELLFHDLRRSAVRNMIEKVGLSEKKAMEISGHKTRAMILRYDIVSLADIKESGQKMDVWLKAQRSKNRKAERALTKLAKRRVAA